MTTYELIGAALPLLGVFLSWWSFRFANEGATPDGPPPEPVYDLTRYMILQGVRYRARLSAEALFNAGALMLAAAVPMGMASNHPTQQPNPFAIVAYALVFAAAIYLVSRVAFIWHQRRDDAFSIYFSKDMRYYDRKIVRGMYFDVNPMPFWSLLDRQWFTHIVHPDINKIIANASLPVNVEAYIQ